MRSVLFLFLLIAIQSTKSYAACMYYSVKQQFMIGTEAFPSGTIIKLCTDNTVTIGGNEYVSGDPVFYQNGSMKYAFMTDFMGDAEFIITFNNKNKTANAILRMQYDHSEMVKLYMKEISTKDIVAVDHGRVAIQSTKSQVSYDNALDLAKSRAEKIGYEVTHTKIGNLGKTDKRLYWFMSVGYNGGVCVMSIPETSLKVDYSKCVNLYEAGALAESFWAIPEYFNAEEYRKQMAEQERVAEEQRKIKEKNLSIIDNLLEEKNIDSADVMFNKFFLENQQSDVLERKSTILSAFKTMASDKEKRGDDALSNDNFDEAIKLYQESRDIGIHFSDETLNKRLDKKILRAKVDPLVTSADLAFNTKEFSKSLKIYEKIYLIDETNLHTMKRIAELKDILFYLKSRDSKIFPYNETNNKDYDAFIKDINNDLNNRIDLLDKGELDGYFSIKYDTLGENKSIVKLLKNTIVDYDSYLSSMLNNPSLIKPPVRGGFYIAAECKTALNVTWYSYQTKVKVNHDGVYDSPKVEYFLRNQPIKSGKYEFEFKEKNVGNKNYEDVYLVNYKCAGPASFLYSTVMPGLGKYKVTYGEKGKGTMIWFLTSAATYFGAKYISNNQYTKYRNATSQEEIDLYYKKANRNNQISLTAAGISATLYVYDLAWVFKRGLKNKSDSKGYRESIKNQPIKVRSQPIIFKTQ